MLHKYPNVVPIPGSKNRERIIENLDAANVELTDDAFTALEDSLNGLRYTGTEDWEAFKRSMQKNAHVSGDADRL